MTTVAMKCKMGEEYRDPVSGFQGIMVAFTQWQHGCVRITLQPKLDKDGKYSDSITFDDPALVKVPKAKAYTSDIKSGKHGDRDDSVALKRN